jgi:phospholipase D1/2
MKRVLSEGRNYWCERPVAEVGLLVDGDDYYRAFYAAAQRAQRFILLAGWQFDSDACLLRGPETEGAKLPVSLKKFLNALCEQNPELHIYMLAWDFHTVFALEREWMQQVLFNWTTHDRLTFRFDDTHVESGAHHQKFVVIDDQLSFLGGLDLCDHRWDDRRHCDPNPLRVSRGEPHKPFHDVQAYVKSPEVAAELISLFKTRWVASGGKPIELPEPPPVPHQTPEGAIVLNATRVALSRTDPHGSPTDTPHCREICDLHLDAIAQAEKLIYIETQYFTSQEIADALVTRLQAEGPALELVIVLNMEAETFKEQVAVGLAQAKVISDLRNAATGTAHRLGIYYTVPHTDNGAEPPRATYIHSKVMVVDDRFLTVGSANLTNRSCVVDTELNLSVESESADDALGRSIVAVRRSLLIEHLGLDQLDESQGVVALLSERAQLHDGRLRLHPSPTENERMALNVIDPQKLPFDPSSYEDDQESRSIFAGGLGALWHRLMSKSSVARISGVD